MIKSVRAITENSFKLEVRKLVQKHGKVLIYFREYEGLRKRVLNKDGTCLVAYKGRGYKKWSKFEDSCFMDYCDQQNFYDVDRNRFGKRGKRKTLKNTVEAMCDHDKDCNVRPLEICYGNKLSKSVFVIYKND